VDALYHAQLLSESRKGDSVKASPATQEDMTELQEELQTLRGEIGSIVQMVVGHEIRDPLLRNLQSRESHAKQARTAWSEYVSFRDGTLCITIKISYAHRSHQH
jgi:hypothetical protein